MRWIPDLQAATESPGAPVAGAARPGTAAPKPAARQSAGVITRPTKAVVHCGCTALPWLACEHTRAN